jgi:hypothetical protein
MRREEKLIKVRNVFESSERRVVLDKSVMILKLNTILLQFYFFFSFSASSFFNK